MERIHFGRKNHKDPERVDYSSIESGNSDEVFRNGEKLQSEAETSEPHDNQSDDISREYEKFLENIKFLSLGIGQMRAEGIVDPKLDEAERWLPGLALELSVGRTKYQAMLERPKLDKLPTFKVVNSEIGFGAHNFDPKEVDKLNKTRAELGEKNASYINKEYLAYGLERLRNLCSDYFEIQPEKFTTLEREEQNIIPPLKKKPGRQFNEHLLQDSELIPQSKLEKILHKLFAKAKSTVEVAVAIPKQLWAEANSLFSLVLMKIIPEKFGRKLWSQIMKKGDFSQTPGAVPTFFSRFLPAIAVENIASRTLSSPFNMRFKRFNRYDPDTDSFKEAERGDRKIKFEAPVSMHYLKTEAKSVDVHTLEFLHFPIEGTEDSMILLPTPSGGKNSRDAQCIPVSLEAVHSSGATMDIPIYYNDSGDCFFDKTEIPPEWHDVTMRFNHIIRRYHDRDKNFRSESTVSEFITQNPGCFSEPNMELDDGAMRAELPEELSSLISEWSHLSSTKEKIKAVGNYFKENFSYPPKFFGSLRILFAEGESNLEKIFSAKEGNCYDTNRLAYIILHKLGVPCDLGTGIAPDEDPKNFKDGEYVLPEASGLKEGTTIGFEGDVQIYRPRSEINYTLSPGGAHAFLRYFDIERRIWCTLDVTPSLSGGSLKKERKYVAAELRSKQFLEEILDRNSLPKIGNGVYTYNWLFRASEEDPLKGRIPKLEIGMGMVTPPQTETNLEAYCKSPSLRVSTFPTEKNINDEELRVDYEKMVLAEYRAYDRLNNIAKEIGALGRRVTEPILNKMREPAENFLRRRNKFLSTETNKGDHAKLVASIVQGFVPPLSPGLLGNIQFDESKNLFVLTGQPFRANKEMPGVYMTEEEVFHYAEEVLKFWSVMCESEIPSIISALNDEDGSRAIENILNDYHNPLSKEPELSAPEKLSFEWLTGRENATVETIDGKNQTVLTDRETGKRYIVERPKGK